MTSMTSTRRGDPHGDPIRLPSRALHPDRAMRPHESGPTLKDVAELAGVSTKTASRVLNEHPKVADDTRAAVQAAMLELHYVPDPAARSLRAGRDRTIGVVVDSIADVFFATLVAQVESVLDAHGYRCLIASSNRDPKRELETVHSLAQRRCAGIILSPTDRDCLAEARIGDLPLVFVDRVGATSNSQSVVADDHGLTRLATRHLLEHGHTRIALLSDTPAIATTGRRHEGYRAAMREAGIRVDERLIRADCLESPDVLPALVELLALAEPPTALISTNTRLSLGLLPALHQFRRTDIALISFGDFPMAESLSPAVTIIDHSPRAIGTTAATAMLDRLQPDRPDPVTPVIYVPADLVQRGSGELRPQPRSPLRDTQPTAS
ncbi:LacI family DNA-binding transcriptional regulator [Pseudactinotalea sp. HY158]|nr:LacI family DNA-binding transcriptional regulator [Pseudactinotalea sp. HY158]